MHANPSHAHHKRCLESRTNCTVIRLSIGSPPPSLSAMLPDKAFCLPTFSHFLIVNKTSLSLSLSLFSTQCVCAFLFPPSSDQRSRQQPACKRGSIRSGDELKSCPPSAAVIQAPHTCVCQLPSRDAAHGPGAGQEGGGTRDAGA